MLSSRPSVWKNILFWIIALLIMVSSAVYQRITGPTHPYRGTVELHTKEEISYRLLRSYNTDSPAPVNIVIPNRDITGKVAYKRYKSFDEWHLEDMTRSGDTLHVNLPQLPAAGKIMYYLKLGADEDTMDNNSLCAWWSYIWSDCSKICIRSILDGFSVWSRSYR